MSLVVSLRSSVLLLSLAGLLSACQTDSVGPKTVAGAGIGAAVGGLGCAALGGSAGACIASAGVGALVGGAIGAQLDEQDRQLREAALRQAAATGRRTQWKNAKSGNSGSVTPLRAVVQGGQSCQVVQEKVAVQGHLTTKEETICN
ncbi:glycine zipper domain-containing protein [Aquabacter sediminis]|uniref:glycine zipper domain-containing protein n=1 Tax=Aquabacter sediminis TaxID=3029197 RepID=UPI00237DF339|nr:glycine zipper domain-containing protein [Aquabacter sp. P-9]MDE1567854.1 glycine zipper domain-containing protein [Aquabacter sp. P-9]